MNTDVRKLESIDEIGLSSFTIRLEGARSEAFSKEWSAKSQPTKLLVIGLLIMTCLCGSIYYGAVNAAQAVQTSEAK